MLSLFREAIGNLLLHRTRTFLAALGIIFGVASVICMLSISEVARRDVIGRIERLGVRNVVIDSVKPDRIRSQEEQQSNQARLSKYGLTSDEFALLRDTIGPDTENALLSGLAPMRIVDETVRRGAKIADVNVVATTAQYSEIMNHSVQAGRFLCDVDGSASAAVCALGAQAAREMFPLSSAIDQTVQISGVPFRVVGVMNQKGQTGSAGLLSDPDRVAWIPFEAADARFGNANVMGGRSANVIEIDRAVLAAKDNGSLNSVAGVVRSMLESRHRVEDYSITIPSALVKEQRQAEDVFRWVMASLAAIALLVGGVGIMNIMLANMGERRQEIGLRRALGATRRDIVRLFLSESTVLCVFGSVVGVALGAGLAYLVGQLASWTVAFDSSSFPLGILVGVVTGLVFGTLPAIKAARLDPVLALRVE